MYGQAGSSTSFFSARLGAIALLLGCFGVMGCEIRPKPFQHTVEYDSISACRDGSTPCSWERSEREAEFSTLVNCLLAGANVLEIQEEQGHASSPVRRIVAPVPPRFGYHRGSTILGVSDRCSENSNACSVASRHDRPLTWASCGIRNLDEEELKGGDDLDRAHRLDHTDVVTGSLVDATDDYAGPAGLDGPDHWYRFTISEKTNVEVAVAANRALWSGVAGLVQSAWQPALSLLSADGTQLQQGYVFRAGVTVLFPTEVEPGTYYVVVDSSVKEWKRGDGLYRLYVGFNRHLMGSPLRPSSSRDRPTVAGVK